ncbi:MAG TPA: hypothetical protein VKG20_12470 [Methylomirabilota bacterium]|nr:hypothetical protein [Methylomirabilota bacterium]
MDVRGGVPRFNMPFELGLAVGRTKRRRLKHEWFVFEARRFRLQRSLSDLNGIDPHIHHAQPHRVLVELTNALVRAHRQPTLEQLTEVYRVLQRGAVRIREANAGLFGARAFRDLVVLAADFVEQELA